MAHFTRVKALGWAVGEKLLSSLMNQLDTNVSKAVNGDDGGTWAPTDPIIFQGDGLQIDTVLNISNGASIEMLDASEINLLGASAINLSGTNAAIVVSGVASGIGLINSAVLTLDDTAEISLTGSSSLQVGTGCSFDAIAGSAASFAGSVTLGTGVEIEFNAPRSYEASVKGVQGFDATEWSSSLGYVNQHTPPNSGGVQTPVAWILDVPPGATITAIYARVDPAGAHGALPGTLPSLNVQEHDPSDGTSSAIANISDSSGSVGVYEAAHDISATGLSHTTSTGTVVYAFAYGEKGANEVAGLLFYPPRVAFTMDQMAYP